MPRTDRMLSTIALLAVLAACAKHERGATPPTLPLPRPGVKLVATPARAAACGAYNFRVHLDWTVAAPQPGDGFDVRVDSPIGAALASGGRDGHADTGDWAHVGQWFFLVARGTGEVVAAVRIGPDDCIQ